MSKYNITMKKEKAVNYQALVSPALMDQLKERILDMVVMKKKYLDKNYSARRMAADLGTNTRYISAVINTKFHMNYAAFINKYRIEEAMSILVDKRYSELRIEEVGDMCGFASRQSFYAAFFRTMGITPRDYRLNHSPYMKNKKNKNGSDYGQGDFGYVAGERFADIEMLRYRLSGFDRLSRRQRRYIYYLSQATLYGRDITFDQKGRYNLRIRRLLEAVYTAPTTDRDDAQFAALEEYLKRVWFASGIHHHYGCDKFVPSFTADYLRQAVLGIDAGLLPLAEGQSVDEMLAELLPVIFDPTVMPKRVNQTDGDDLVATSACNYYRGGVTQGEAEAFYAAMKDEHDAEPPSYGLNTTLVKETDGQLTEHTWTTSGLYGPALRQVTYWLEKARQVAENDVQKQLIKMLISYYRTGSLRTFDEYSVAWTESLDGEVDFINGFIEVYGDPLGLKGSWEGLVEYVDHEATRRTETISAHAQWFEDHSPVDPRFRKQEVRGVTARAICAAMLGGDEYPATAIGINLPNADWIRARYGSKSVRLSNITEAYNRAAQGSGMRREFVRDAEMLDLIDRYSDVCDDLHTDLHECVGHGSGQLLPGTDPDALKSYGSTIEEARADLFGLYFMADDELVRLGLLPDNEAYKAQYYQYMLNGLMTQLVRIQPGRQIEEAHMRNRALIARWCLAHAKGMALVREEGVVRKEGGDGEEDIVREDVTALEDGAAGEDGAVVTESITRLEITDFIELRQLIGQLLAEVQRIKSEGDYEAARQLVETYGVTVDSALHHEVLARYRRLHLAPYKGFINPRLVPIYDKIGRFLDVHVDYTEGYAQQMLRYSRDYATLI